MIGSVGKVSLFVILMLPLSLLGQQREWATMFHTANSHDQRFYNIAISSSGDIFTAGAAPPTAYLGDSLISGIFHNRHGIILHLDGQNGQLSNYRRAVTDSFAFFGGTFGSVHIDKQDRLYVLAVTNVDSFQIEGFKVPTYFQYLPEDLFGEMQYFINYSDRLSPLKTIIPIASDIRYLNLNFRDDSSHILELQWRYFAKINEDSLLASEGLRNLSLIKYNDWDSIVFYKNVIFKQTSAISTSYGLSNNLVFLSVCRGLCEVEDTYSFNNTVFVGSIPLDSTSPISWIKSYPHLDRTYHNYVHVDDQDNIYFFNKINEPFRFAGKTQVVGYALFSLDKNGNERWAVHFGKNGKWRADNISVEGNNIYIRGDLYEDINFQNININYDSKNGLIQSYLLKIDRLGNGVWGIKIFDSVTNRVGIESIYSKEGEIFLILETRDFIFNGEEVNRKDFDGKLPTNVNTFVKIKDLSYEPVGNNELATNEKNITIYPNPNNGTFTIDFGQPMQSNAVQVNVMDIQGRMCYSESRYVKDQTFISLGMNLKPGIYIVSL